MSDNKKDDEIYRGDEYLEPEPPSFYHDGPPVVSNALRAWSFAAFVITGLIVYAVFW